MIDSMMKAMGFHRVRNGTMDRFVNLERGDVFLFCGMIFRKIDLMDWLQWNL